jgi:hypothetical protein
MRVAGMRRVNKPRAPLNQLKNYCFSNLMSNNKSTLQLAISFQVQINTALSGLLSFLIAK